MDKVAMDETDMPTVQLKKGIDLGDLMNEGGLTFEVNFADIDLDAKPKTHYDPAEVIDYSNYECHGNIQDEDVYTDAEPFEQLAKKMVDIAGDKVKKRIIREGYGEIIPEKCVVHIGYNAYVEYNEDPFDSTYARKREHTFRVGEGETLIGLDIGVQTMKINEKAQFLVKPEYAYGVMGCFDRIPANSTVLFEVELFKYVNSGATVTYDKLEPSQKKEFKEIYKYALARCEKANDLVNRRKNYRAAIREYNKAATLLDYCQLADYDEQEQQQKLLLRLHTNLVVCAMKADDPKKCCISSNIIFNMCKGTNLVVPIKVYYNNARALMLLNDLDMAEKRLRMAAARDRDNSYLVRCFLDLDKLKEARKERYAKLSKALLKSNPSEKVEIVSDEFKTCIQDLCDELNKNSNSVQYDLPAKLSDKEIEFAKTEARNYGLLFVEPNDDNGKYIISKPVADVDNPGDDENKSVNNDLKK